jgi:hypothetical protein
MMTKPTIVVVGCLSAQARQVEKQCRQLAKLKFVKKRDGRVLFPSGDHLVLWAKFLSHSYSVTAYRYWPRNRVHHHWGGVKELATMVQAIAAKAA